MAIGRGCFFPLYRVQQSSVPRTLHQARIPGRDVIYREAGSLEVQHEEVSWVLRAYKVSVWLLLGRALRREEEKMGRGLPSAGNGKKEES